MISHHAPIQSAYLFCILIRPRRSACSCHIILQLHPAAQAWLESCQNSRTRTLPNSGLLQARKIGSLDDDLDAYMTAAPEAEAEVEAEAAEAKT